MTLWPGTNGVTLGEHICTHLLWLAPGASLELAAKPLGNVAVAARRAILACGKREGEQKNKSLTRANMA